MSALPGAGRSPAGLGLFRSIKRHGRANVQETSEDMSGSGIYRGVLKPGWLPDTSNDDDSGSLVRKSPGYCHICAWIG